MSTFFIGVSTFLRGTNWVLWVSSPQIKLAQASHFGVFIHSLYCPLSGFLPVYGRPCSCFSALDVIPNRCTSHAPTSSCGSWFLVPRRRFPDSALDANRLTIFSLSPSNSLVNPPFFPPVRVPSLHAVPSPKRSFPWLLHPALPPSYGCKGYRNKLSPPRLRELTSFPPPPLTKS